MDNIGLELPEAMLVSGEEGEDRLCPGLARQQLQPGRLLHHPPHVAHHATIPEVVLAGRDPQPGQMNLQIE